MKKFIYILFGSILLPLLTVNKASASHAMGADLSYTCLGPNAGGQMQYRVTLRFYRDCSGINVANTYSVTAQAPGCYTGTALTFNLAMNTAINCPPNSTTGCEVSPICPANLGQTTCSSGSGAPYPGVRVYEYSGNITLPVQCAAWQIRFTENARNPSNNTNGGNTQNLSIIATVNNTLDPFSSYRGIDSFQYVVCDNGIPQRCDTAWAYLNVGNTAAYPPIVNPANFTVESRNIFSSYTLCTDFYDYNPGDSSQFFGYPCLPANGTIVGVPVVNNSSNPPSVCINYSPNINFAGRDTVCIRICDRSNNCDTGYFYINVVNLPNIPPLAQTDRYSITTGDSLIGYSVLLNDDPRNSGQSLTAVPVAGTGPANGSLSLDTTGRFIYRSVFGFTGIDSFSYRVCDNGSPSLCDTGVVLIQVLTGGNNYAPETYGATSYSLPADSNLTVCLTVLDPNRTNTNLSRAILQSPTRGTLSSSISYNGFQNFNQFCFTYSGSGTAAQDSAVVLICDGLSACDTVVLRFDLTPVPNRPPNAWRDIYQLPLSTPFNGSSVLGNDNDPNSGQTLSVTLLRNVGNGTLTLNANGTFTYTPRPPVPYCNNSTVFASLPIPFVCVGQNVQYNNGGIDRDNDSIVYSLVTPLGSNYAPLTFQPGYSVTQPVQTASGFNFNTTTGQMQFIPANQEVDVLAILVNEYRNGVLVGSTMRDVQVQILANCQAPPPLIQPIANLNNGFLLDSVTVSVCPGNTVSFDVPVTDPNNLNLTLSSNLTNVPSAIPRSIFTVIGSGRNASARISWQPLSSDTGCRTFIVGAKNDNCPINGQAVRSYRICVPKGVDVDAESFVYCGTPIRLLASGTANFRWSPTNTLSDTTSLTPLASPTGPTWYKFTSDCGTDSVRLNVAAPFQIDAGPGATICQNGQFQLNATLDNLYAPYQIRWQPSTRLIDPITGNPVDSIRNPIASPLSSTTYYFNATGTNGCVRNDSVRVNINGTAPSITAQANPSSICFGQQIQLRVVGTPISCGLATTPCTGNQISPQIGTGTSLSGSATQYPSIYGNYLNSARHQFLYTAAEILALTGSGGTINSLAFNIGQLNSSTTVLQNFTIKMGCTGSSVLNGWESGLVQVFNPRAVNVAAGWNTHVFDNPFNWDGTGNVVVEICFSNTTAGNLNNRMQGSTTTGNMTYYSSGNTSQCGIIGAPVGTTFRPNVRFNMCVANLNTLQIRWQPNAGSNAVSDSVISNPTAAPQSQTTYQVRVADSTGCVSNDFVTIYVDTGLQFRIMNDTFLCGSGPITIRTNTIGSPLPGQNFTYSWTSRPAGPALSGSQPTVNPSVNTTYICTVSGGACVVTDSVLISVGTAIPLSKQVDSISCFNANDGQITFGLQGGVPPYTYTWSPAVAGNVNSRSGLSPGTYRFTVSDSQGCSGRDSVSLLNPAALNLSGTVNNPACNGQNSGSIALSVSGGAAPYNYIWSPSSVSGSNPTSLSAGTYIVTVTDNRFCSLADTFLISQPPALNINVSGSNVSAAGGNDGSARVAASGGSPGYTYSWSNAASTDSISNLIPGVYRVTVCDLNNCCLSDSILITDPPPITITFNSTDPGCFNQCSGSARAFATGGVAPYSFSWSNLQTGDSISALCAGTYTVTVTDSNGVAVPASVVINQPAPILIDIDLVPVSCFNGNNGQLLANVSGGVAPYTFSWSIPSVANPAINLAAGTYRLTVTDRNGCRADTSATLLNPPQLELTISSSSDPSCFGGSDGTAGATATGGTGNYVYTWSRGNGSGATVSSLNAGLITVTVTDINGCSASARDTISQPAAAVINLSVQAASCLSSNDGLATILASGGLAPYSYRWDGIAGGSSISTLAYGSHTVRLIDANNCFVEQTFFVDTLYSLRINMFKSDALCSGSADGTAEVIALNGTAPFSYSWSPAVSVNSNLSGLTAGSYRVTVTDARNCAASSSVVVAEPVAINVAMSGQMPSCSGDANGAVWGQAAGGSPPYRYSWNVVNSPNNDSLFGRPGGVYELTVTDGNNCSSSATYTLTDPAGILLSLQVDAISCTNDADGRIEAVFSGGTLPLSLRWSNNSSNSVQTNLAPGLYALTITDARGCTRADSVLLSAPPPMRFLELKVDSTSCYRANDGRLDLTVSGGTPGTSYAYNYYLNGGQQITAAPVFYNLSAGFYRLQVKDDKGCTLDTSFIVAEPAPLVLEILPGDTTIPLGSVIPLQISTGNYNLADLYFFDWSPSTGLSCEDCAFPLAGPYSDQLYTLRVKYRRECEAQASIQIRLKDGPDVYIPNSFSPNGDGVNEIFNVYGNALARVKMLVFNRWGEKIFESVNQNFGWDGRYRGELVPPGVYVYSVEAIYLDGKKIERTGSINLIR